MCMTIYRPSATNLVGEWADAIADSLPFLVITNWFSVRQQMTGFSSFQESPIVILWMNMLLACGVRFDDLGMLKLFTLT